MPWSKHPHKIPWRCRKGFLGVQFHHWDCEMDPDCNGDHNCVYCGHNPHRDLPVGAFWLHPREKEQHD